MDIRRAAKTGRGPALFDLLPTDQAERTQPPDGPTASQRGTSQKPAAGSVRLPGPPDRVPSGALETTTPGRSREPLVELDGDRIRFSFTSVTAAAAVFVLMGLLASVYWWGRSSGWQSGARRGFEEGQAAYSAAAISDIEAARRQPPATHVIGSLLEEQPGIANNRPDGTMGNASAPSRWVRDHTYVVVQEFVAGREEDARAARAYLAREGIETEIVAQPSGAMQLISAKGFNRSDPTQRQLADQLIRRVHELGAAYWASGGGYKLEGYFKTLKNDSW